MLDAHPGEKDFNITAENFRPNIVLDLKESFKEDEFFEMRVGPLMMRNSGTCIRCSTIRTDLDSERKMSHMEPYSTLCKFRTVPGSGPVFGMYYQMNILFTKKLYQ